MSATYTRKGSYSLSTIRTALSTNSIFNSLSEANKNTIINLAVQKVATLRNSLGLEDYNFDTATAGSVFLGSNAGYIPYTKYLRFVVIEAGQTHKGTTYPAATILIEESFGFASTPSVSREDFIINVESSGEFSKACDVFPNSRSVTWDGDNPDNIAIDITETSGIVSIEVVEK